MSDLDVRLRQHLAMTVPATPDGRDLTRALAAVLDLHEPRGSGRPYTWCGSCRGDSWPCRTVRAIAEKLGVEVTDADPA